MIRSRRFWNSPPRAWKHLPFPGNANSFRPGNTGRHPQRLGSHFVRTAYEQGWSTFSNGDLLQAAEEAGFDVLLTPDTGLPQQQSLKGRKLAVVILSKNRWTLMKSRLPEIVAAINSAKPGTYSVVEIPDS